MAIKVIYSVLTMYDKGREIPAHNHAHRKGTRGVLLIDNGLVDVRKCHQRHASLARLVDEQRGLPIEGFKMHDIRVATVTAECMMIYGTERHEDVGVYDYCQAWWCIPVASIPLQD
jgi:hypothetical protein